MCPEMSGVRKPLRSVGNLSCRPRAMGFTLIELMIVVAIVGILSAIAMPQYQLYTGRAQLTEAIQLTEGLKTAVSEGLQTGMVPASINGGVAMIPVDVSVGAGRYVESIVVAASLVVTTMKATNVSSCVASATVTLTPVVDSNGVMPVKWTCSTTATCKPVTCS